METTSTQWYLNVKKFETWAFIDNLFSKEECEKIKDLASALDVQEAWVGDEDGFRIDNKMRKNTLRWMPSDKEEYQWIFRRCTDGILDLNRKFWDFNLDYIESLQYTEYIEEKDYYDMHIDMSYNSFHNRKLSFSIQLDDPETYEGSDLLIHTQREGVSTKRTQGTMIAFPSYVVHQVTPITSGERRSLVGWVCGPTFK